MRPFSLCLTDQTGNTIAVTLSPESARGLGRALLTAADDLDRIQSGRRPDA